LTDHCSNFFFFDRFADSQQKQMNASDALMTSDGSFQTFLPCFYDSVVQQVFILVSLLNRAILIGYDDKK